jgi:hypothetical protein
MRISGNAMVRELLEDAEAETAEEAIVITVGRDGKMVVSTMDGMIPERVHWLLSLAAQDVLSGAFDEPGGRLN